MIIIITLVGSDEDGDEYIYKRTTSEILSCTSLWKLRLRIRDVSSYSAGIGEEIPRSANSGLPYSIVQRIFVVNAFVILVRDWGSRL